MKHVAVPFSYSVHVSTPIRGRNGRRGYLLSPLRLLPSPLYLRLGTILGFVIASPSRFFFAGKSDHVCGTEAVVLKSILAMFWPV